MQEKSSLCDCFTTWSTMQPAGRPHLYRTADSLHRASCEHGGTCLTGAPALCATVLQSRFQSVRHLSSARVLAQEVAELAVPVSERAWRGRSGFCTTSRPGCTCDGGGSAASNGLRASATLLQ